MHTRQVMPCVDTHLLLQKLFKYISGNNVDNAKISMTTPVVTFVKPSADFKTAEKNYTVAFYLPQQFQVWCLVLQYCVLICAAEQQCHSMCTESHMLSRVRHLLPRMMRSTLLMPQELLCMSRLVLLQAGRIKPRCLRVYALQASPRYIHFLLA